MVDDLNARRASITCCAPATSPTSRCARSSTFARGRFDKLALGPARRHRDPRQPRRLRRRGRAAVRGDVRRVRAHRSGLGVERATDARRRRRARRSALADRARPRRARADRHVDQPRDAVVHRVRPARRGPARAPRSACSPIRASPARSASSRSTIRPPASAPTSRIRGLRDHAAFAAVIAEAGADLIVHGHEHRDMTEALAGAGRAGAGARRRLGDVPPQQAGADRALPDLSRSTAASVVSDHVRVWDRERRAFAAEARSVRRAI